MDDSVEGHRKRWGITLNKSIDQSEAQNLGVSILLIKS